MSRVIGAMPGHWSLARSLEPCLVIGAWPGQSGRHEVNLAVKSVVIQSIVRSESILSLDSALILDQTRVLNQSNITSELTSELTLGMTSRMYSD